MKRITSATMAMLMVGGMATAAMAQGFMMGPGGRDATAGRMATMQARMAMMQARMGAAGACPGWAAATAGDASAPDTTAPVTEDRAKALATEYATKYFKDYTVERVLPFQGRLHTAYQVELRGPKGDTRLLHVNPWGAIRPFAAPFTTQ